MADEIKAGDTVTHKRLVELGMDIVGVVESVNGETAAVMWPDGIGGEKVDRLVLVKAASYD